MAQARVLIIDDQPPTRYIFRRILTHAGYEVVEAVSGAQGLEKALTQPDLIISDVNLPDMLGYEVTRRLRANPATASIPIMQISASFVSNESRVQALEGGADSYLTQPVEPTVLLAQVSALLRGRRNEALSSLSARQWQATFDALSEGLALVDADGLVLRANRALLELLDVLPSDIEGKTMDSMFALRFGIVFASFLIRNQTGAPVELPSGGRWLRLSYSKLQGDPENESGSVLLVADITDQKKLQQTLRHSERLAATGRLAHVMAHEINNPLEAMSNLLYLVMQGAPADPINLEYVAQASQELQRISHITKQVLAYHRESKQPIPTPANELLESALAMFRVQMITCRAELNINMRSSALLTVHPGEIRQVFGNLLANSLDAMDAGGRLRIRCADSVDPRSGRRGVRFAFSDTGMGIADKILSRIFEAFYTTKDAQGSGIGLWLSAEIIEKHQGLMQVRTRTTGPYRGTLFSIFLPSLAADS